MVKKYTFFSVVFLLISFLPKAQESNLAGMVAAYSKQKTVSKRVTADIISTLERQTYANPAEVMAPIEQLLVQAKKIKDHTMEVNLMRVKGAAFFYQGKFPKAEEVSKLALQLAERYKVINATPRIYAVIGNAQVMQSQLVKALETQNKGLKIAEKLNDQPNIHLIKNNLVAIHLQFYDYDIAKEYLEDNIKYFSSFPGGSNSLATNYNNLSLIYEKQKNYHASIRYLHKALAQNGVSNNKILLSQIYNNLGSGYNKLKQNDSAYYYFNKAFEVSSVSKSVKSQAVSKIGLSEYYYKTKQYEKAKSLALQAFEVGIKVNSIDLQKESSDQLLKVYSSLNMPDSAMIYKDIASHLGDSIVSQDNTRKITKLQMQYDFGKKEDEYKHLQAIQNLNLQQQVLQNQLSQDELDKSLQEQQLQSVALENQKLQTTESTQKLKLANQEKSIIDSKNKSLLQENELAALKLKQFWLYAVMGLVLVGLLFYLLWNRSRINRLRVENKLKEKEADELLQKNKIAESELKAIRSQMNPHFIFNVLNSIESYIVESDSKNAQELVQKFAKLSRMILENSTHALSTLESEWKINQLYTEIEYIRFDQHFTYHFNTNGHSQLHQYLIPPMIIQPIIENAILHGLRYDLQEGAHLEVSLKIHEKTIEISVVDNGVGLRQMEMSKPKYKKSSFGLASVRNRIELLNKSSLESHAAFSLVDRSSINEKGCIATLVLPIIKAEIKEWT